MEARHPQLPVTRDHDVQRPGSRQNITCDNFPGRTGVGTPAPQNPTRAISLEDKGVGGSGWVTERRNFRIPKVRFLFRKTIEVCGQAPRVAGHEEFPHLHTHTGWMAAGSPWFEPSWEEAWIPHGRKRASWPRWPMTLEPDGHLPPPLGQKSPMRKVVALDRPEGSSPAARKHFDWHSTTKGPVYWELMPRD
jgi:hypothetical protein